MRVTNEADYALRIMQCLSMYAHNGDCPSNARCDSERCESSSCGGKINARALAELVDVPQRFTLKILRKLMGGGLVKSYKGASGGYSLALPADRISMKDIIELIDGPLAISRCLGEDNECININEQDGVCIKKAECYFHRIFNDINSEIAQRFESITLDMVIGSD